MFLSFKVLSAKIIIDQTKSVQYNNNKLKQTKQQRSINLEKENTKRVQQERRGSTARRSGAAAIWRNGKLQRTHDSPTVCKRRGGRNRRDEDTTANQEDGRTSTSRRTPGSQTVIQNLRPALI